MASDRFTPRPRVDPAPGDRAVDRWPALEAGLLDLLSGCSQIVEIGRETFGRPRSLVYRAAEAVVIHFDDRLGRLPAHRIALLPPDLSLGAVTRTRNILSHDDHAAREDIEWDVIEQPIPQVIAALVR